MSHWSTTTRAHYRELQQQGTCCYCWENCQRRQNIDRHTSRRCNTVASWVLPIPSPHPGAWARQCTSHKDFAQMKAQTVLISWQQTKLSSHCGTRNKNTVGEHLIKCLKHVSGYRGFDSQRISPLWPAPMGYWQASTAWSQFSYSQASFVQSAVPASCILCSPAWHARSSVSSEITAWFAGTHGPLPHLLL